jgi:hypothetical protein
MADGRWWLAGVGWRLADGCRVIGCIKIMGAFPDGFTLRDNNYVNLKSINPD